MKRIFVLVVMLFISTISIQAYGASKSYRIVWSNTSVEVPLYGDIDEYKYIPKASLYIDNQKKDDAVISISTEGDWLYLFNDVNVNKVGEYKVWYKATETKYKPGTCNGYKQLVSFKVVDNVKPEIYQLSSDISFAQGETISLDKYFKVSDNYSKNLKIEYFYSIDNTKCGTYDAKITATDESNNTTTMNFSITIYNSELPKIVFKGVNNKLSIQKDEQVDIRSYFQVTDDFDLDIETKLVTPKVDTSKIGSFDYTVSVKDSSNQEVTYQITIEIVDNIKPEIALYKTNITENYMADLESINFLDYVKSLIDNNESLNINLITVSTNIINKVGTYHVNYEYIDEGGNKASASLEVILLSNKAPKIQANDIHVKQGQKVDLEDGIIVTDDSDPLAKESLVINGDVDFEEVGTYEIEAYAINSSGLSQKITFRVYVEEDNALLSVFQTDNWVYLAMVSSIAVICLFIVFRRKKEKIPF